ncbi:hypothetical protein C5D30_07485 [Rathayibacter toxicus]|uniref:Uncharacterized protein n=1 Tax=Rathayibacter toxicus TaxID=145458 RepID=A0A0C5BFH0_9MICO|nr:hypothetical protein TI83_07645 [Rathayibacter toxicus]ALS57955.1 hypothetical protein APU90_09430 [Rathayibacter toxicus]KKM44328.1 hypothetical protein VT73_10600 [Rathayibacter toxicus]PPG20360.1 hypothetical protein C5D15_07490 [Rathayibacter toxicus]PPG45461.1 hypothetical protein C5D16_07455 [Rathayibacter toxicus]
MSAWQLRAVLSDRDVMPAFRSIEAALDDVASFVVLGVESGWVALSGSVAVIRRSATGARSAVDGWSLSVRIMRSRCPRPSDTRRIVLVSPLRDQPIA